MPRTNVDMVAVSCRRFNDFIRGELRRKKLTQEDLAEYLDVDKSTVSRKFRGELGWSLRDALKATEFLDADIKEIL